LTNGASHPERLVLFDRKFGETCEEKISTWCTRFKLEENSYNGVLGKAELKQEKKGEANYSQT
jgi:hypothetical protein